MKHTTILLFLASAIACSGRGPVSPASSTAGTSAGVGGQADAAAGTSAVGTAGTTATGAAGTSAAAGSTGSGTAGTASSQLGTLVREIGGPVARDADILFVVDNSSSMRPLVNKLTTQFPAYINALASFPGGMPNVHIGVVSADIGAGAYDIGDIPQCRHGGDQGILQNLPRGTTCNIGILNAGQRFISDVGGQRNYTGTLADVFSCIASLGDTGCGYEHQLGSALRALGADGAGSMPFENVGFLRNDAFLQVVILTNEDDCSAPINSTLFDPSSRFVSDPLGPVSSFRCNEFGHLCNGARPPRTPAGRVDLSGTCTSAEDGILLNIGDVAARLKGIKADPSKVLVGVLGGPPAPYVVKLVAPTLQGDPSMWPAIEHSCMATDGTYADPGIRLKELTDAFGGNGLFREICTDSFQPILTSIAASLVERMTNAPCVEGKLASAFAATNLIPDCTVVDHVPNADGTRKDVALPHCALAGAAPPCWMLAADPAVCVSGRLVRISRSAPAPAGLTTTVTCRTCPPTGGPAVCTN